MIGLIQRASEAKVTVEGQIIGEIQKGIVALVCVEQGDTEVQAHRLMDRVMGYRVFSDAKGRMDRSLLAVEGGLLLVPQFTLAANTDKGTRASFSKSASPELGQRLFDLATSYAQQHCRHVATGRFGADMQVSLVNDGPVTFWLRVKPQSVT